MTPTGKEDVWWDGEENASPWGLECKYLEVERLEEVEDAMC